MPRELVAMFFFSMVGVLGLAFSPIGRAFARRLSGARIEDADVHEMQAEMAELRSEVDELRSRMKSLSEMEERLDFAERVIAQQKPKDVLPGPRS